MRELVDKKSEAEGRNQSRLPTFDEEWKTYLKGSLDFLGVNHYTTELINPGSPLCFLSGWICDQDTLKHKDASWEGAASAWLVKIIILIDFSPIKYCKKSIIKFINDASIQKKVPWGLRKLLNWIKETYNDPEILITESGWSDAKDDGLNDDKRIGYFRDYVNNVMKAVLLDNVTVKGYAVWSLMDNFEWANGYK